MMQVNIAKSIRLVKGNSVERVNGASVPHNKRGETRKREFRQRPDEMEKSLTFYGEGIILSKKNHPDGGMNHSETGPGEWMATI
jgi:hypothetical protein